MKPATLFASTHWSIVLAAGADPSAESRSALEKLCATYWYPLYAFVRREGYGPEDAQDSVQGFFVWLLESGHLSTAAPERGRFRSFLLCRLKHYLSDERKKAAAQKRGGGQTLISLDAATAEERYGLEPATDLTADRIYERRWALTILERTVGRLREEYVAAGRGELFEVLKAFQSGEDAGGSYRQAALQLGLTESAVKSAIYRLRQRHRDLLREEIAQTVSNPAELEDEIRHLIDVVGA